MKLKIIALALFAIFACNPVPFAADASSPALSELQVRACTAADGSWACAGKRPQTFKALGTSPIIPVSWTVPSWFVNKTTGNDQNDCVTALTACKTKQEIWVHRLGCGGTPEVCPRFRQNVVLEQDVSDTDNSDPIYPHVGLENGATFILQGGPGTSTAAVFTRSAAKSRVAGANSLLAGSFSAGAPAVAMQVQNTTALKSSKAWIYKTAGGANWSLTQPLAPTVAPPIASAAPAEVDTWNTGDTVNLITPIAINVPSASAIVGDFNGAGTSGFYLYNMVVFDPAGIALDQILMGGNTHIVESVSQRWLGYDGGNPSGSLFEGRLVVNSFLQGGALGAGTTNGDPEIIGGAVPSTGFISLVFPVIDGDFIDAASLNVINMAANIGFFYLDSNLLTLGVLTLSNPGGYGQGVLYGSGANTILLKGTAHFANRTGNSFVASFTAPGLITGIQLNGGTSVSCHTNADPDVFHTATTTPAHLDAACGAGTGLGSNGFQIGGASVSNF